MPKIARKYMAHYIDASTTAEPSYERLGKDLEEYTVEMSASVNTKKNILGETSTSIDSYEKSASVDPYFADSDDAIYARLQKIIDEGLTLDDLNTTVVEVHLWEEATDGSYTAYRENAVIEVSSYGGNTEGYQIPFTLHYTGGKTKGTFNVTTKTFTADV